MMSTHTDKGPPPTLTELVKGIANDVGDLVRQEVRFARTEISSDFRKTRVAVGLLTIGGATFFLGSILSAISWALWLHWLTCPAGTDPGGLSLWASFWLTGVVFWIAGVAVAWLGWKKFETFNPLPNKTLETIQENVTLTPANSTGEMTTSSI